MVSVLMVLGGTLCGIEEEAVAFYPILVPIFIAMGYDSIICVGAIFLASSVGSTFSTVNPFSVVIASNAKRYNIRRWFILENCWLNCGNNIHSKLFILVR